MDSAVAATVIGVLLSTCFAAFATAFAWLRADMNSRFERLEDRFGRLEAVVQGLIVVLARSGQLTEPGGSDGDD